MNAAFLFIIGVPAIEIYLMIKVGGVIGALNTILLIFVFIILKISMRSNINELNSSLDNIGSIDVLGSSNSR